ncbi:fructose 1,6-bisphosphatase [Aquisalimonas lutea]|uniref:fructose 1,6-bisphosphatase n=1 Tax=Aquisalimonas lutea TaxID=1327750 RepID=UPI0025B311D3|nr:fructose 1,6-bisphosphatase [Aquisalimonas lutea]MDN3517839.1 fructose 1,6-bisphosphatase [Aquisalimonas lutea]
MRITLSLIKADVGSIGGHTQPSADMLAAVRERIDGAVHEGMIIDSYVSYTGDDIAILMSHTRGEDNAGVHELAWNAFLEATDRARRDGLYGAGQDLLADAPSGNVRGAGPAVAEIEFEHDLTKPRPAESFMMFAADKCGPGAYNLPFYLGFADPMYCAGLMLPKMIRGFTFRIIDMERTDADYALELDAPEDAYRIAALLRDNERFAIESITSRTYSDKAVSISAQRLHSIAGEYTGKDDPVALVRNQGIFPAPEELLQPFTKAHYVGGDARGSHNMPLMPVPVNTAVTGAYCLPVVSCVGFSLSADGHFSREAADFFDNPAWDETRRKAQHKALEMRSQGWSGPAMLPYTELEYGGFRNTVEELLEQFRAQD